MGNAVTMGMGEGIDACGGAGSLIIFCLPINAILGAGFGAYESYQLDKLKKDKGIIEPNIYQFNFQQRVEEVFLAYTRDNGINASMQLPADKSTDNNHTVDYNSLKRKGIDTVIEFELDSIRIKRKTVEESPLALVVQLNSKLIRTKQSPHRFCRNDHQYKQTYLSRMVGKRCKIGNGRIEYSLTTSVNAILDHYLMVYYPTVPQQLLEAASEPNNMFTSEWRYIPYYVLSPRSPEISLSRWWYGSGFFLEKYDRMETRVSPYSADIENQSPLLKWEPFPWDFDLTPKEQFSDIVYDLVIYQKNGPMLYSRQGLKTNEHQVEMALQRNMEYVWSVRARFKKGGKPRVTEWGGIYTPYSPDWMFIDNTPDDLLFSDQKYFYYPFRITK
jgi:hypothetical protein